MSYHTPAPWPTTGRIALALVLASSLAACTEQEQQSGDAILAAFGVTSVKPPEYAVAVVEPLPAEPEPVAAEPEPVAYEPPAPPPECRPVFRVYACDDNGEGYWL